MHGSVLADHQVGAALMAREHDDHRNENHSDHMTNDDAESNGGAGTTSPQDSHEGE